MKALRPPLSASPVAYLFRFRCPRQSSLLRARCFQRSRGGEGPSRARIIVKPAILIAGSLSRGREWNISGSQATRPVPLPRSTTPAEPACPCQCGPASAAPALSRAKASAINPISRLTRSLSGRTMARCGLRMMPPFPSSPRSFRKAGFPRYGWKVGLSGGTFPARRSA
jgi:hypothetical protein